MDDAALRFGCAFGYFVLDNSINELLLVHSLPRTCWSSDNNYFSAIQSGFRRGNW